jgi:hypothetical protein
VSFIDALRRIDQEAALGDSMRMVEARIRSERPGWTGDLLLSHDETGSSGPRVGLFRDGEWAYVDLHVVGPAHGPVAMFEAIVFGLIEASEAAVGDAPLALDWEG